MCYMCVWVCIYVYLSYVPALQQKAMMPLGSATDEAEFDDSVKMMVDGFFCTLFPNHPHLAKLASFNHSYQDRLLH